MSEIAMRIFACVAGMGLGAMFFGGLWWTLGRAMHSERPALWFISSALLRMGLALSGLYLVSAGHWQRMLACLVGFSASRFAVGRLIRRRPGPSQEGIHAAQP